MKDRKMRCQDICPNKISPGGPGGNITIFFRPGPTQNGIPAKLDIGENENWRYILRGVSWFHAY